MKIPYGKLLEGAPDSSGAFSIRFFPQNELKHRISKKFQWKYHSILTIFILMFHYIY